MVDVLELSTGACVRLAGPAGAPAVVCANGGQGG